ncbi:MAG: hypothetical protein ACRC78_00780 [Planktothrix sp.]
MECRKNRKGEKMCHIVTHPDKNWESFCPECNKRFIKKNEGWDFDGVWAVIFVLGLFFLILMLNGCKKPANSDLIRSMDISNSGLNHPKSVK